MEAERLSILKELSSYSEQKLSEKPSPNQWSVAEVIMHLVIAERGALAYMNKKLEFGGHGKAAFGSGLKQRLLNLAITIPGLKYKAPTVVELKKEDSVDYAEAKAKWDAVRSEMKKEYEALNEKLAEHELFKHPAAGKMSLLQGIRFMRQHMNRHIGQIRNTAKAVS